MTIDEIFNTYDNSIKSKTSPPEWITSTPKSGLTRNITIEDWNSVIEDISHIASDCKTIDEFIRKYKEYVETKFEKYVTSEYFEEQFENLNNIFNTVYLKANAAYALAESNSTLITQKPTVYFENNFAGLLVSVKSYQGIKQGDIFILTRPEEPDFVAISVDANVDFSNSVYIKQSDIPSNIPAPEVGKIYTIEGIDYALIAIESGVQTPATDSALNANSTNPVQNKVISAKFSEIEQKLTNVSGKSNVLLYTIDDETNITDFINTFLQEYYDNLNPGDVLVARYYYNGYYKDYVYILRQESPMVIKTWHLLTVYDTGATSGGNITVEQQVNDSTNPVSSVAVKNEFGKFSNAYDEIIRQAVVTQEYFYNGDTIITAHNKDYHASEDIANLTIQIGTGISSVMFKIVDSGDFNIEFMGVNGYIGKAPDFKNGETWELSIHNGIIASGKVVSE